MCQPAAGHEAAKRVSRRVGKLGSLRLLVPTWRDMRAAGDPPLSGLALGHPGAEACRRHLFSIKSLGISLPCQVLHADLLLACTWAASALCSPCTER